MEKTNKKHNKKRFEYKKGLKRFAASLLAATLFFQPLAYRNVDAEGTQNSTISPVVDKVTSLKPKNVPIKLDNILDWSPENVPFDYIQRASVPLQEREKGAPINEYASEEGGIQSLTYLLGNNLGRYSSVGDY